MNKDQTVDQAIKDLTRVGTESRYYAYQWRGYRNGVNDKPRRSHFNPLPLGFAAIETAIDEAMGL